MSKLRLLEEQLDAAIRAKKDHARRAEEDRIKAIKVKQRENITVIFSSLFICGSSAVFFGVIIALCKAFVAPKSEGGRILLETVMNFGITGLIIGMVLGLVLIILDKTS